MQSAGAEPGRATAGLIMLHGRGGTAEDILSLLGPLALPDVAALAPEAPGNSWWPSSFLAPTAQMEPFVCAGLATVREGVSALEVAGLARNRIWLCGFSQGACLALEAFAREGDGLAGVFGLSGGLVGTADAPGGPDQALFGHNPKYFVYPGRRDGAQAWISVHARDPHIPLVRAEESGRVLHEMGAVVEVLVHPGAGHSVMQADLMAMRARLNG